MTRQAAHQSVAQEPGTGDRFEANARTVSLLTLASRLTGLARDAALSRVFGAGGIMDAFFFAFMIPNLFRRLFGEGALAAAFLPVYSKLEQAQPDVARQLASLLISRLVTMLGIIVLVAELALYLVSASLDHSNPAVWLTMIMLPYMPLVCMVAILGAMLQVHHRFGPTAAAPIVLNVAIIATAIGLGGIFDASDEAQRIRHIGCVAASVIVAGVIQVIWSLAALRQQNWWTRETRSARQPMRDVTQQVLPMILGLGVLQLNTFFDGLIASYPTTIGDTIFGIAYPLDVGAMSSISYAQRLYQFPLGVFGIAIATAIYPLLARQQHDERAFADTVRRGLRLTVFIGLPASVGLILVREPLTAVILQGGRFTLEDTRAVAFVLLGYAPAIWAYSMIHVLTRAFYARGDSKTPVKVAVSVVALNLVLNCSLIWTPLREAGLAWSTSICAVVQVIVLLMLLRRRIDSISPREVWLSWGSTAIASIIMAAIVLTVLSLLPEAQSWWQWFVRLMLAVFSGCFAVVLTAMALRMPELRWALGLKPR